MSKQLEFDAWWENARQSWTAIEGDLAKDVARSAYAEGQAETAERVRRETLEEAAQCAESWKLKFRHEPEQCDPCKMGDLMAGELRALAQKGRP